MIPLRDVIPSRTRPTVTIAIIVLNALAFLFEITLSERELQRFVLVYGVVPAAFSWTSDDGWLRASAMALDAAARCSPCPFVTRSISERAASGCALAEM